MYPISYDVAYEVERNRLTTFFRLLVALPWLLWIYLYGIAAMIAVVIAWFALMFTKRYPAGLYSFICGFIRLQARVSAYALLLTDALPPFSGKPDPDHPVQVGFAGPAAEYRRSRTFFKCLLYFPQGMILGGLGTVLGGAAFVTWWRVMFTGKQSITMHDALRVSAAYTVRAGGFLMLLTEHHPRMLDLPPQRIPPGAPALPPGE